MEPSTLALQWLAADPDPATRAELQTLLEHGDPTTLSETFGQRLSFGTAGLRGLWGPGPGRINRLLIRILATACSRVALVRIPDADRRGIVVCCDARRYSAVLAREVCGVLAGLGIRVHRLRGCQPTPLAVFAIRELNAAASLVLTASHNPPAYHGCKLYWDDGAPLRTPVDQWIGAAMAEVDLTLPLPWLEPDVAQERGLLIEHGAELETAYLHAIQPRLRSDCPTLRVVYTPLHGVAGALTRTALEQRGFAVHFVAEQFRPDGTFPTLDSPNPEHPEALRLALVQARHERAELVLAQDPDGDRLAVAVPGPDDEFTVLDGDQVGWLLAEYLLENYGERLPDNGLVLSTIVSSCLLGRIAAGYGVAWEQTLTGFKWIWRRALEHERAGGRFLFGYEQALGYSVCPAVRDKDGISAALLFAELARDCAGRGQTVLDRLDALHRRFGYARTRSFTLPLPDPALAHNLLERLRHDPPTTLAGQPVRAVIDWQTGYRVDCLSGARRPTGLPCSEVLQLELEHGRISLRPSGTEPIFKIYLESCPTPGDTPAKTRKTMRIVLNELETTLRGLLGA